jgi:precorrin-2/cobalt-factor-2 C20-methyltransferase
MKKLSSEIGTIYGVGLGPGSVDLMSVRADKLIKSCSFIAFFRKAGRPGHARQIVSEILPENVKEYAMEYPVTTEIPLSDPRYKKIMTSFYDECCRHIKSIIKSGEDVCVLCEGDPFFYGSFMHIYERLRFEAPIEVVPAITGMSAAWTASGLPITWGDNILTILTGTLSERELVDKISTTDAAVIMKVGQNLDKIRSAITLAKRESDAFIVEFAAMSNQSVCKLIEYTKEVAPYFSIIILHGEPK